MADRAQTWKTWSPKASEIQREWLEVDAKALKGKFKARTIAGYYP